MEVVGEAMRYYVRVRLCGGKTKVMEWSVSVRFCCSKTVSFSETNQSSSFTPFNFFFIFHYSYFLYASLILL